MTLLPNYNDVLSALDQSGSTLQASQAHGLLCGIICLSGSNSPALQKALVDFNENQQAAKLLLQALKSSCEHLENFSFEFRLLLPNDKTSIQDRTEALGLWCQGFITGLGEAGIKALPKESEAADAANSIIDIAQINFEGTEPSNEDEIDLFELIEYVRLATLMIYDALKPIHNKNATLH